MSKQKFASFDIDGTIARTSLYHTLVDELVERGVIPESVRQEYEELEEKWRNREHADAFNEYVQALVQAYEPMMTSIKVSDFEEAAEHIADRLKERTYVYTRELAKKLKDQGYFLIAISGSHKELVEPFARHYGFDDFVAYEFERDHQGFTGRTNVTYKNKDIILKKLIEKHDLDTKDSYGIGDSRGDIELLHMVDHPIAFNPEQRLLKEAQENGWKIVIERKNVIYQMENLRGQYRVVQTGI